VGNRESLLLVCVCVCDAERAALHVPMLGKIEDYMSIRGNIRVCVRVYKKTVLVFMRMCDTNYKMILLLRCYLSKHFFSLLKRENKKWIFMS